MKIKTTFTASVIFAAVALMSLSACNKLELDPTPIAQPVQATSPTLANLLDDPNFSLLKAVVNKAGLMAPLADPTKRYTVFAPDNAAITASLTPILPPGVTPEFYINNVLTAAEANGIISYHVVPQVIPASSISTGFPNFQYPTILNPAPSVSALLRLTTFPSVRPGTGAWVNNVPITGTNIAAVNGMVHKVFRIVMPPSQDLWAKINAESDLTYLKAAINRADSGVAAGSRLQDALNTAVNPAAIGSNLTVFAPNDNAMSAFLTAAITQALIGQGFPAAVAQATATTLVTTFGSTLLSNPASIPGVGGALSAVITPTLAKGIVAYHVISSQGGTYAPPGLRVFSVNLPTTATSVKTLLNSAVSIHPGVVVQATFASPVPGISVVTAATVKGLVNTTPSNVVAPDLHCVNGVIHKIDQVLRPQ
jgi:uncharacterized surface protein with fasciclin (FAS1) repeats